MTSLEKAVLELDADVNNDGSAETGVFHMVGNVQVTSSIRTGFLVQNSGSNINAIASDLLGSGNAKRRGFFLDLGGGQHVVELQFTGWKGAQYTDNSGGTQTAQWGNTGNADQLTVGDATGEGPITQMQILMNYLRRGTYDSRNPARLQFGEYNPNGVLDDHLGVVIEQPHQNFQAQNYSTFDGTITCIEAQSFNQIIDAKKRQNW